MGVKTTGNWTIRPANWEKLRLHWEYAHTINARLYLIAFIALLISVLQMNHFIFDP